MLRSLNDLSGFNALCAHLHPTVTAAGQLDADRLQIRVKAASGLVISV
jgi:hypothetical protein